MRARIRSSEAASIACARDASLAAWRTRRPAPPGPLLPISRRAGQAAWLAAADDRRPDPGRTRPTVRTVRTRQGRRRSPAGPGTFSRLHKNRRADGQKPGRIFSAKGFMRAVLSPVGIYVTPPYSPPVVQFDGGRRAGRAGSAPPRAQPSPRAQPWHDARAVWYHARIGPDHFGRESRPKNFLLPVGE